VNKLLQWEIQWVKDHPHLYEGPMHQRAVMGNLEKRYYIAKATSVVTRWSVTKWVRDEFPILEHFNLYPPVVKKTK